MFDDLWITCERLVVVKWVTLLGRLPGACSNVGEHAQARVDELCPNEPAISTASYTVGKTRLLLPGSPENLQRALDGLMEFLPSATWFERNDTAGAQAAYPD